MRQAYRSLITAVQFLTRFKAPDIGMPTTQDRALSIVFYPVVGAVVGAVLAVSSLLAHILYANALMAATAVVAVDFWVTGGLHLDGLMDSADGLLAYRSKERTLEIMRDSHVGAMAVMVLIFTVLLRIAALSLLAPGELARVVLVAALFARSLLLVVMRYAPSARSDGRGSEAASKTGALSAWIAVGVSALISLLWLGLAGLVACVIAALGVSRLTTTCERRIGGMTGDTYGASIELAQLLFALTMGMRMVSG